MARLDSTIYTVDCLVGADYSSELVHDVWDARPDRGRIVVLV